jgi:hypothetical protein
MRDVVGHSAQYLSNGCTVNKLYRQFFDLFGDFNADIACKIAAYNVIEKIHVRKFDQTKQNIDYSKGNYSRKNDFGKIVGNKFAGPKIIKFLNKFTEKFGRNYSENNGKKAKEAGKKKPSPNWFCFLINS